MSSYIVDTSIVVQRLIRDTHTEQTKRLFKGLGDSDELMIPEFCLLECTNVLWKQVRFQGMPAATARSLVKDLLQLPLSMQV